MLTDNESNIKYWNVISYEVIDFIRYCDDDREYDFFHTDNDHQIFNLRNSVSDKIGIQWRLTNWYHLAASCKYHNSVAIVDQLNRFLHYREFSKIGVIVIADYTPPTFLLNIKKILDQSDKSYSFLASVMSVEDIVNIQDNVFNMNIKRFYL
jgi:hypothetical protein